MSESGRDPEEEEEIRSLFAEVEAARESFQSALDEFKRTPISLVAHEKFVQLNARIRKLPRSLRGPAIEGLLLSIRAGHVYLNALPEEDVQWILGRIKGNWLRILETGVENVTIQDFVADAERGYRERQEDLGRVAAGSVRDTRKGLLRAGEALTGASLIVEDVADLITAANPAKVTSVFAGLAMFWRGVRG